MIGDKTDRYNTLFGIVVTTGVVLLSIIGVVVVMLCGCVAASVIAYCILVPVYIGIFSLPLYSKVKKMRFVQKWLKR